jgi:hypothetical protein
MRDARNAGLFAIFIACAAVFVWLTSAHLPAMVASHFDGAGLANGFMPHGVYIGFMLAMVILLPASTVYFTWLAMAGPDARINLPNKEYWLAPERRDASIAYLRSGILFFGFLLVVFLCYVHWLVVQANATQPVRLDNTWFVGGLAVFFTALVIWLIVFLGHFRLRR